MASRGGERPAGAYPLFRQRAAAVGGGRIGGAPGRSREQLVIIPVALAFRWFLDLKQIEVGHHAPIGLHSPVRGGRARVAALRERADMPITEVIIDEIVAKVRTGQRHAGGVPASPLTARCHHLSMSARSSAKSAATTKPVMRIAINASLITAVISRRSTRRGDRPRYRLMRPAHGSGRHSLPGEPSSSSGNRVEVVKACTRSDGMATAPSVFVGVDCQMLSEFVQVCAKMAAEPRNPQTGLRRRDNAARRGRAARPWGRSPEGPALRRDASQALAGLSSIFTGAP